MQLKRRRRATIASALGMLTAELFAATTAHAQTGPERALPSAEASIDDTESDLGLTRVDASVIYYREAGGRVKATEPVASVTVNDPDGGVFALRLTADILTGATPNGTTPASFEQAFVKGDTKTGASGVTTAAPNALPLDPGFRDKRYAADAGYSFLAGSDTRVSLGGALSHETDYRSYSVSLGLAQTFNNKNTTAGISVNFEHDRSKPHTGTPPPLAAIDGLFGNTADDTKTVKSLVAGLTQVISRTWLFQVNYSFGRAVGYQTDPYRLISVIDPRTGGPAQYLYEGRPRKRTRHSVYVGNKIALGATVLDLSGRLYKDSWGVKSITLQASERIPLTRRLYVEPMGRYYHQSQADFFRYYLLSNQPLPDFASSDVRLGKFDGVTAGLKLGLKLGRANEIYVRGEYYKQMGDKRPAGAPGDLARQNLFSGVKATTVMFGYSFAF